MGECEVTLLEMVQAVSDKTGVPKTRVKKVLKALFHELRHTVMSGESVTLHGFGKFDCKVTSGKVFGKSVQGRKVLRFKENRRGKARRSD